MKKQNKKNTADKTSRPVDVNQFVNISKQRHLNLNALLTEHFGETKNDDHQKLNN